MVYMSVHYGFGQTYNDMCPPLWYHTESFHRPNNFLCSTSSSLLPNPRQPLIFLPSLWFLPLPECHIVGIIQSVAIWDWPLSLSDMHWRFLYVFSSLESSFLFSTEKYFIVCRYHSLFFHSPPKEHLGCFQLAVDDYEQSCWTFVSRLLCAYTFSVHLGKHQGAPLLGRTVRVCLVL